MFFRLYRKITRIEFKDFEVKNKEEVLKHWADPKEGFKITDDGNITDYLVTENLVKECGNDIFIKRDLEIMPDNH